MSPLEIKRAMQDGHDRFRVARSGRIYRLDPAQECLIEDNEDDVLLIGFPEQASPRNRGRKWQWLAPKNLALA